MKIAARPDFGAEVTGLDLRTIGPEQVQLLKEAVYHHQLLVLHDALLDEGDYVAMARKFGTPQRYFQSHYHHPEFAEIFVSNNVPMGGQKVGVAGTGRMWHSDYQFFPEPLPLTFVMPRIVPPGGTRGTMFVDLVRALRELPPHLQAPLATARCFQDAVLYYKVQPFDVDKGLGELMEEFHRVAPGASHPAIVEHPVHGRRALYVSSGFTQCVEGMTVESSRALLRELFAFVEVPERVHMVPWQLGDLFFWDNRQLIHRATGQLHGQPSRSYRIGIYDGLPFYPGLPVTGENQP